MHKEPRDRFSEPAAHFKKQVHALLDNIVTFIPEFLIHVMSMFGKAIHWASPEYVEEVDGIAKNTEVDLGIVMFLQYMFEFTNFCTSTIVKTADGTIIHDRNLDFAFAPLMRNITFVGVFYKGDEYLFDSTIFAGYNGVMSHATSPKVTNTLKRNLYESLQQ